jgi:hypothetical protein
VLFLDPSTGTPFVLLLIKSSVSRKQQMKAVTLLYLFPMAVLAARGTGMK